MFSQFAGLVGLGNLRECGECFWDDACSSAVAAVVTRDSNSESPTCIGGGLGIRVGWLPELGGLFGLGDPRLFMGGRAGDEGDVSGKGC